MDTESQRIVPKVLVLGTDDRSFLAAVRSLGRGGAEVHVAWHGPDSLALRSRYVARVHDLPPCDPPADGWRDAILALLEREAFDWVLPTNDPATLALHELRAELGTDRRVYLPPEKAFDVAFDKLATWELARSLGVPVPEQRRVVTAADAATLPAELGLPVVLKPRRSFRFGRRKWEHLVRKAYDEEQLAAYLSALLPDGEVLAQANHVGEGVGVEVLADEGEVVCAFQHVRLHEPPLGGGSTYRKGVPLDDELLEAARALVAAMEYSGVAMFEFKRDARTGAWVLIEINARFWGSLPLAVASGADFPWWLYRLQRHGERPRNGSTRTGLACRNVWMDLRWLAKNARADHDDPTLCTRTTREILGELKSALALRERSDALVLDDPVPGLVESWRVLRELARTARGRLAAAPLRSRAVRRVAARRLRVHALRARNILFVCRGNICRSPFAAALARPLLEGAEVASAGYHPEVGRPCPREAIAVAARHGVDLARHRSRMFDERAVQDADLVLVFDDENRRAVLSSFPYAAGIVHRVGLLSATGPPVIKDPYSGAFKDFEAAYAEIAHALGGLAAGAPA